MWILWLLKVWIRRRKRNHFNCMQKLSWHAAGGQRKWSFILKLQKSLARWRWSNNEQMYDTHQSSQGPHQINPKAPSIVCLPVFIFPVFQILLSSKDIKCTETFSEVLHGRLFYDDRSPLRSGRWLLSAGTSLFLLIFSHYHYSVRKLDELYGISWLKLFYYYY